MLLKSLVLCCAAGLSTLCPVDAATLTLKSLLSGELATLAQQVPGKGRLGLLVRDLSSGQVVEALRPDELFVPASTTKLISMAARLSQAGPGSVYRISVMGQSLSAAGRVADLTLRGAGDPSFAISGAYSLAALARQLKASGVREVGELRVGGPLDSQSWPALPLGTPVVEVRLREYPGWNDSPQRYAGRVTASFAGQLRAVGIQVGAGGPGSLVGQAAPQGFAATLPGQLQADSPVPETELASVQSAPLLSLVRRTLKPSDNVWAEQLAAGLGLPRSGLSGQLQGAGQRAGTHASMLAGMRRFLEKLGLDPAPLSLHDASGLSESNRLTPRVLVTLLGRMYDLPFTPASAGPLTPETAFAQRQNLFIEALPRGGTGTASAQARAEGGTLAGRFVGSGLDVRAKTGTLPGAAALAGYVRGKSGHLLAFAVLLDQSSSDALTLRAYEDKLLRLIAARH